MNIKKNIKILLAQLSFFTILPSPKANIEEVARGSVFAPILVGLVVAAIEYIAYYAFWLIIGSSSKYVIIIVAELLRGFNHLDGLLDFGDGIMVRGSIQRKISAMKDKMIGSGGLGLFLVYLLIILTTFNLIPAPQSIWTFLIILSAEVVSRALSLILIAITEPIPESTLAKLFNAELKRRLVLLWSLHILFIIFTLPTLIISLLSLILFREISIKNFRGISGDVAGAFITLSFPILLASNSCLSLSPYHYLSI